MKSITPLLTVLVGLGLGACTSPKDPDFSVIVLPDTQFYSSSMNGGSPALFEAQTQWIVASKDSLNIVFVTHLGDCVQNGDEFIAEWHAADTAISYLEDENTTQRSDGIPYGIAVGNHDQSPVGDADGATTYFNQFFGVSRFEDRNYYGGHYGASNDNHYQLFSAGRLDFIILHLEYDKTPDAGVLTWAGGILKQYAGRRGIVVTHHLLGTGNPAAFGPQGHAIYNALKDNSNLFLMLGGHVAGEGQRVDTYQGHTVYSLLSDYQSRTNGGDGWLRILQFSPEHDEIRV